MAGYPDGAGLKKGTRDKRVALLRKTLEHFGRSFLVGEIMKIPGKQTSSMTLSNRLFGRFSRGTG